jgi:hypothetical protein
MFKDRSDIINIILGIILLLSIGANVRQTKAYRGNERFEWGAGVFTPAGNTVQVADCAFVNGKYWNYNIRKSMILDSGWTEVNYTERTKENALYPDSLHICWFSYNERKFYEGNFNLPYQLIFKQAELLRKTTTQYEMQYARANPDKILLYLVAEVLPQGKLNIWLTDLGKHIKISSYQAKAVNKDWTIFNEISDSQTPQPKVDIAMQVALVMEPHSFMFKSARPGKLELQHLDLDFFNQNNFDSDHYNGYYLPMYHRIPERFNMTWGDEQTAYTTSWNFKKEEILAAFRELDRLPGKDTTILKIQINEASNKLSVALKRGTEQIDLANAYPGEIYKHKPEKNDGP